MGGREILTHAGMVSHDQALRKAELEFEKFRVLQLAELAEPSQVENDFDAAVKNFRNQESLGIPFKAPARSTRNRSRLASPPESPYRQFALDL